MNLRFTTAKRPAEQAIKDICRATPAAEDKIRIVLDGLRGEDSIAELCRRENITQSLLQLVEGVHGSGQAPACW